MVAQYTVEGMANPMAVTEYQLGQGEDLPPELQAELPAISEISAGVEKVLENAPAESVEDAEVVEDGLEGPEAPPPSA